MKRKSNEDFIKEVEKLYGDKYDYSKVNYTNSKKKVCVICKTHGEFWITPNNFLNGHGCPKCNGGVNLTTEAFLKKVKEVNKNKYDLSKAIYKNSHTKICVICPKHGEFWIRPNDLLNGVGCPKCANLVKGTYQIGDKENFIKSSRKIHGDLYDYSKVKYVNNRSKVCIICNKHGEFWQSPHNHLSGNGCPNCSESKLEKEIRILLSENGIKFDYNKSKSWLDGLRLDFYLPKYNTAIECQGIQHFEPVDFAGRGIEWAENNHKKIIENDKLKEEKCHNNKINLIYFSDIVKEGVVNDKTELLKLIKSNNED